MAERRMLSKTISTSRKVNRLPDRAALLYTWMIPHTDDYGRMEGDAKSIKAKVVPMRDSEIMDVEKDLEVLREANLITRYSIKGEDYLEINFFDEFQTFRSDRPRRALYPKPEKGMITNGIPLGYQRDTNGIPPGDICQRKLSKGKVSKDKNTIRAAGSPSGPEKTPNPDIKHLMDFFHRAVKAIRGHDPAKENGGQIGTLLKIRLEKDKVSPDRIEKMVIWYLTRKKRYQDEKKNWHETFKNPPEFAVMLSNAHFSALLTDEVNALTYMADNFNNLEKLYRKIDGDNYKAPETPEKGVMNIKDLLKSVGSKLKVDNETEVH